MGRVWRGSEWMSHKAYIKEHYRSKRTSYTEERCREGNRKQGLAKLINSSRSSFRNSEFGELQMTPRLHYLRVCESDSWCFKSTCVFGFCRPSFGRHYLGVVCPCQWLIPWLSGGVPSYPPEQPRLQTATSTGTARAASWPAVKMSKIAWVWISATPLARCLSLGKLLSHSRSPLPHLQLGAIITSFREDY